MLFCFFVQWAVIDVVVCLFTPKKISENIGFNLRVLFIIVFGFEMYTTRGPNVVG